MRRALVQSAVLLLLCGAVVLVSGRGGTSVGETGCSRLVQSYLAQAALDGGIEIVSERVLACRQDGNSAVARVALTIEEAVFDPFAGTLSRERRRLVVVLRFAKSPWQVVNARVVDPNG